MAKNMIATIFITNKIIVKYSLFAIMLLSANCPDLAYCVNKIQAYKTKNREL